ncbi:MAG TPA: hypothetical protein VD815_05560 [Candidatus Saccharimonadales bacterium]|nr:hypothetical protein [Candidatus Saccharimonadales bacterium]
MWIYKGELQSNAICISIMLINNKFQIADMLLLLLLLSSFMINSFAERLGLDVIIVISDYFSLIDS